MSIKFQDIYDTEVTVSISGSGYYRIDGKYSDRRVKKEKEFCISMTENQANILINALKDIQDDR